MKFYCEISYHNSFGKRSVNIQNVYIFDVCSVPESDINILSAVFISKKTEVYLEKQVSWKQKLIGREWPSALNEFQLPLVGV